MLRILFICTGNTCRSPMAQVLLQEMATRQGKKDRIEVSSAGIAGGIGGASQEACAAMTRHGLDLTRHRSRRVTRELMAAADLVLTMTAGHKRILGTLFPEAQQKIWSLAEFAEVPQEDIADPLGGDAAAYQASAEQIERLLVKAWKKIAAMAG